MTDELAPRYPIYVISKGRADPKVLAEKASTAYWLQQDGTPFRLVVEPQEADAYAARYGADCIAELPFRDLGQGSIPARNWCWEDALAAGAARHWCVDDNIKKFRRLNRGRRIPVNTRLAFSIIEDFADRYTNVAIAGMNYQMFVPENTRLPFYLNVHVYSVLLIDCSLPFRWRGRYNEDTDLCLQVLSAGLCTVLFNALMADKLGTGIAGGGNQTELYRDDGRLKMARSLERAWPHVVSVDRRFQRPQHVVRDHWAGFDQRLIRRTDIDWGSLPAVDNYGMELTQVADEIRSPRLRTFYEAERDRQ